MLHQPIAQPRRRAIDQDPPRRRDRSMDALQYVTALLAIVVAILLAAVR